MLIRNATITDAEAIARIHILAWRSGYKGILPDEYLNSLSIEKRTKQWLEALSQPGPGINLVLEYRGIITGFCVYGPARDKDLSRLDVGELIALNVLPDSWGIGVGKELIKYVLKSAGNHQWPSLYLWVIKENVRARNIYESAGFILDGSEKSDTQLTGCTLNEVRYINKLNTEFN